MPNKQLFIDSQANINSGKVVNYVLKRIDVNIDNFTIEQLNDLILRFRPKSPKEITTVCYVLGKYSEWIFEQGLVADNSLYQNIQLINKKQLWEEAKSVAEKKFISYVQYRSILHDITVYEQYNPLYYEALFSCVFEGIYTDDLSVIKNLRGSDIDGTTITLYEDNGNTYKLKISESLSLKLKTLSSINTWTRPNRYGICHVPALGLYPDTVFKIEKRKTGSSKYPIHPYYARLRKIYDEYIGYKLEPKQLYVSGIMHRIKYSLSKHNIALEEAFSDNSRDRIAHEIVNAELARCNNIIEIGNFRELVKGHIEVFSFDPVDDISDEIFNVIDEPPEEYLEGKELWKTHRSHERNKKIISLAKARFKETHGGKIYCEKCGFDFGEVYGEYGDGFIEAHHTKAISKRTKNEETKVEDLVLLCSNCHSMVHHKQPWLTMEQLENILKSK